ncbi:MAG: type IX secretion system motor protein PorM/GldM [Paludibacteraceae bacterium]
MSGAKNCPETPRQRMIGMMYLVLTAMLALNVSSEILNGFGLVDSSLRNTIASSETRNSSLYDDFEFMNKKNPAKVKEWLDQALEVKKNSDELYNYLKDFKYGILKIADGTNADKNAVKIISRENIDAPGEYALVKGNGKKLRKRIEAYREFLKKANPSKAEMYNTMFATNGGARWESKLFDSMPVSASITLLTKYQSDIRSAEAETVQYLKSRTDFADFRVNRVQAYVVPNSRYIIQGGRYSADIILAATDSTRQYEYFVNGSRIPAVGGNKFGKYEFVTSQTGTFRYSGVIRMPNNQGGFTPYPFTEEYTVGKPAATISNEDLNVVYRGIDNRFSVSVPGIAAENVRVMVEGGTATKTANGNYIIRANQDGQIKVLVSAMVEGREQQMGSGVFRVKYLPDPIAYLQYTDAGGVPREIKEGRVTRKQLQNARLIASYGEDALVQAKFDITSFTQLTLQGVASSSGSQLSGRQKSDLEGLEGGDVITFKNIKAVGPDGKTRSLGVIQVEL